jgi:CDP-glucose 4,6-dehydratase
VEFGLGAVEGVVGMTDTTFWLDRPVMVTGASGFLGGWLVKKLAADGASVVAVVRDWIPLSQLLGDPDRSSVQLVSGDIRDQELIERTLGEYEVETVFHLAAQTTVGVANRNPVSTFDSNIRGTWSVLEACRRSPRVRQIVLASSDKAYGDQEKLPYEEDAPLIGTHPYDVSKSCADLIAQAYAVSYGLPVVVTRCGNFYGGGDLNWNRIVPGTIRSIIRGERPIIRSDGQYVRDYFYVEDGVYAYMHLAEQFAQRPELGGEAFNFSNEIQVSVLELVNRMLTSMGSDLKPEILCEAGNEIRHQYLSARKAREVLGWEPKFTLEQGLARAIDWYKKFLSRQS